MNRRYHITRPWIGGRGVSRVFLTQHGAWTHDATRAACFHCVDVAGLVLDLLQSGRPTMAVGATVECVS